MPVNDEKINKLETQSLSPLSLGVVDPNVLENDYYKISFDPGTGGIFSIIDKELNREIVNPKSPFQFNQYIYDRYTTAPRFNHLSSRTTGNADNLLGKRSTARLAKVQKGEVNSVYQTMKVLLQVPGCDWMEQEIILYHQIKRIDIVNRLMKTRTEEKEAVYFSFPFQVENGKVQYEITGDHVSQEDPHVPGSCQYMKAIQHWLSIDNPEFTVLWGTVQTPLIEIGNIFIPYLPFEPSLPVTEPQTVYSYALNNIWDTNFPHQQGGEIELCYSITTHAGRFDPVKTAKFGSMVQNPLTAITVPSAVTDYSNSYIHVDAENVQLLAVRKITESRYSLSFQEIGCRDTQFRFLIPGVEIKKAFSANVAGGDLKEISVTDNNVSVYVKKKSIQKVIIVTK